MGWLEGEDVGVEGLRRGVFDTNGVCGLLEFGVRVCKNFRRLGVSGMGIDREEC